ncbi:MAG: hypothetical protein HYZ14_06630 [Bacteroidetes bacterium]|nr:hypothetical protein [Bacteroidota bacterium]
MSKFFLISLLIFNLNKICAQYDSIPMSKNKFQYGTRCGFYFTSYQSSLIYSTQITITKGIHEFAIGPSFGKAPSFFQPFDAMNYSKKKRLNGFDFSYRILPNGQGKIFDFYFQFDYLQKWGKGDGYDIIPNYPNLYDQTKDNVNVQSKASVLLFEYGFDIKFLNYFYVGTSIGIGGKFEFRKYEYETLTQYNYKETLVEADFIYRANFGFRF